MDAPLTIAQRAASMAALGQAALGRGWAAIDALKSRRSGAQHAWMAAAFAVIVCVCAAVAWIGPTVIAAAPWDVFALLDGGWRMFNGQVPGADFYTTSGPLTYWLISLGMHIGGPSLMSLVYSKVIFLAAIGPWALFVFFRKFSPPVACLLTAFVATLATATHALGHAPEAASYAMIHNRQGWALVAILWAQLLMEDRAPGAKPGVFDALSAGLLLGLLFLCKITYFLFGGAALALALALRPELRGHLWRTICGFASVCLLSAAAFGFNIFDYFGDIAFAGAAQSAAVRFETLKQVLKFNFVHGLLSGGVWLALVAWPFRQGRMSFGDARRTTLICAYILAGSALISIGNTTELGDLPPFVLAGAVMIEAWTRKNGVPRPGESAAFYAAALVVIGVFFGGLFTRDVSSVAHSYAWRAYRDGGAPETQYLHSPNYRDLVVPHTSARDAAYSRVNDTPGQVNRGIALLRRHVSPTSRVTSLAVADPFSMALGLPPSRGAPLWWNIDSTFNRSRPPAPDRVFQEADFVIHPLILEGNPGCCQETVRILLEAYADYLERHFVEAARTDDWVLLKRLTPGPE